MGICSAMEQDVLTPEKKPAASSQALSPFACFLAAFGVTMGTLFLLGAASAATVWAFIKLLGLPDPVLYVALAIGAVPVVWATIWVAGRAWHVEQRLSAGLDIDTPNFSMMHYFRKAK